MRSKCCLLPCGCVLNSIKLGLCTIGAIDVDTSHILFLLMKVKFEVYCKHITCYACIHLQTCLEFHLSMFFAAFMQILVLSILQCYTDSAVN